MLYSNCCKFLYFCVFRGFPLVEPDFLETQSNKSIPFTTLFVPSVLCETLTEMFALQISLFKSTQRHTFQGFMLDILSLQLYCSFLSSCLNTAELVRGAKTTGQCCQVDRKPQWTQQAGAAEHTLRPISCECCCYVHSYSAAFVKNLRGKAESAPTTERFNHCRHLDPSVSDCIAIDSQKATSFIQGFQYGFQWKQRASQRRCVMKCF